MRKLKFSLLALAIIITAIFIVKNNIQESQHNITELRKHHEAFLRNGPFKETLKLTKDQRKAKRLPPNKYSERQWELTMNPATGQPEPKRLLKLQEQLREYKLFAKSPGENSNNWVERGPNNVGGRTRAIMFDPNDATNKKVFAGGISGGLWVNYDITDANSSWMEVNIPQNLAISCITYDPNNTNIFYVGTGESYVSGQVNGNGLYKSSDAGASWTRIFGGVTGETTFLSNAKLTVNSPGSISGEYQVAGATFGPTLSTITGNLVLVNDGTGQPSEGCNALVNGFTINGNIAVVLRGNCNFTDKVLNAQSAGATAVLVVNNAAGPPITQGGTDPGTITIPSVMIAKDQGQAIIDQLGNNVNVTIEAVDSPVSGRYVTPGIQHINDVKVRNVGGGNSEVYVAVASTFYADASPSSIFGIEEYGLYKSSNSGESWSKLTLPTAPGGSDYAPNDIEVGASNTIWVATTNNAYGTGGGAVLSSTNGTSFTLKKTILNGVRTQIAVSSTDADKLYVLAELASGLNDVAIISSNDSFATSGTTLPLPNDADPDVLATDFTRGQAFYDLLIEIDPTDDTVVYVGGIDLFKSSDSGVTWSQLSHWYGGFGFQYVHPDQHGIAFGNNTSSIMMFSNDGGVYYSNNSGVTISERNKNYNTLQFYKGAIGPDVANEKLLAGAQDNGSQLIGNGAGVSSGINSSTEIYGGDGAYVFIDKDKNYMIASYVYNNYYYKNYTNPFNGLYSYDIVEDDSTGDFINPAALDDTNNILYSNGTSGTSYKINRYILGTGSAIASNFTNVLLLTGAPTAFKPSTFTTTTLFVGTDNGKLFKIAGANSAPVWTEITGNNFYGSISCIELGATENDIFVTFYNYGVTSVFYTNNGGSTWQNKEGNLPDLPVRAILMNPLNPNEVIVGTDLGVWASPNFNDSSPNWYQSQNGMKDVIVTSFDLRTADNTVLASTYGRGMFTGKFTADSSTLSLADITKNDLIKIYPTVSSGNFTIAARNQISKGEISIYDLNGKQVYDSKVYFSSNPIQKISINVSSGLYILKFKSENIQSIHKIIIK